MRLPEVLGVGDGVLDVYIRIGTTERFKSIFPDAVDGCRVKITETVPATPA
jgi:hypothetical protein